MRIKPLDVFTVNRQYVTRDSMWMTYLVLDSRPVSDEYDDVFYVEIGYTYKLDIEKQTRTLSIFEARNRGIAKFSTSIFRHKIPTNNHVSVIGKLDRFCVNGFLEDFFNPERFINPNTELLEKAFRYFSIVMNNQSESSDQIFERYKIKDFGFGFNNGDLKGTIEFEVPLDTEEEKRKVLEQFGYKVRDDQEDKNDHDDEKKQCKKHKGTDYKSAHSTRISHLQPPSQGDTLFSRNPVYPKSEQKYYSTAVFKCNDEFIPDEARMKIQKYGVTDILEEVNDFKERFIQPLDDIVNNAEVAKSFIREYQSMSTKRFCNLYGYSKKDVFKVIEAITLKYKVR